MTTDISKSINRAKELLRTVRHAAMATTNADGSPHNSPFMLLHDDLLTHVYWASHPSSQHSQNILRTGQIFIAVFDAMEKGGLYIEAGEGHPLEGAELDEALKIHNDFRAREGQSAISREFYAGNSPQRMWSAKTIRLWVNGKEQDPNGKVIRDYRREISARDLL